MKLWGVGMAGPPGTRSNLGDARSSGKWVEVPAKWRGSSSKLTVACETHVGFGLAFGQARTNVLWTCVITVGVVLIGLTASCRSEGNVGRYVHGRVFLQSGLHIAVMQRFDELMSGVIPCNLWRSMFLVIHLQVEENHDVGLRNSFNAEC